MNNKTSQSNPQQQLEDAANEGWDLLQKYQGLIMGVLLVAALLITIMAYRNSEDQTRRASAWSALFKAEQHYKEKVVPTLRPAIDPKAKPVEKVDPKFQEVLDSYKSSSAAPFALLELAEYHYEKGEKADLEKSLKLYEQFRDKHGKSFPLMKDMLEAKIKAIKGEIAHAPSWMPKKEPEKKADEKKADGPEEAPKDSKKDAGK